MLNKFRMKSLGDKHDETKEHRVEKVETKKKK